MSKVRARFYVASITRHAYNPGAGQVVMQAVARGEENKTWASATPQGRLEITIGNPDAMAVFDAALGKEVTLTFEVDEG